LWEARHRAGAGAGDSVFRSRRADQRLPRRRLIGHQQRHQRRAALRQCGTLGNLAQIGTSYFANNSVTNSILSTAGAATLKGNPTASTANVQDFTIQGLTAKASPDPNNDYLLLYDATGLALKKATPGSIAAVLTSGVTSLNGMGGAVSVVAGQGIAVNATGGNVTVSNAPITTSSLTSFTIQDASSSQDKLTQGASLSSACDPAYLGGATAGPCGQLLMTPNATGSWNTLNIQGTNARTLVSAIGGAINLEMMLVDTNAFGIPVWNGGNQGGAGFVFTARTGANAPAFFNLVNQGAASGIPSGAEGSMTLNIWSGSSTGLTQGMIDFFNATGCTKWSTATCSATLAGARLGEIAGNGMSADGVFTQTETASINFYAQANWSGTHTDGSYQAPTNIVIRTAPNSLATERNTAIFDSNANLLVGTAWSTTSVGAGAGAIYARGTPNNIGAINLTFNKGAEQGLSIQNSASDTGGGNQIVFQNTGGTVIGSVSGTATIVAYNTTSDRRLKTDIVPAREDAGAIIDRLNVVDFRFREDPSRRHIGFIAQDEYKAFPEAVTPGDRTNAKPGDKDFRPWQRDDSKLVPLLVAEMQSMRKRMKQLEHGSHARH
jgi:hypothetical protein